LANKMIMAELRNEVYRHVELLNAHLMVYRKSIFQ
jgi:hypothetical protein